MAGILRRQSHRHIICTTRGMLLWRKVFYLSIRTSPFSDVKLVTLPVFYNVRCIAPNNAVRRYPYQQTTQSDNKAKSYLLGNG